MSAPDPKERVAAAMTRLRRRVDKLADAAALLGMEGNPVRQVAWAVDIIEQGRDAVTDLLELVSAASVILYRGQESP